MNRKHLGWSVVVVIVGLAVSTMAKPAAAVIPVADNLKPAMKNLCASIERVAADPMMSKVDPPDRATVVIATVNEQSPGLEAFFNQVAKLPATERLDTIKRSVSAAIGSEWKCPKFDELWNAK